MGNRVYLTVTSAGQQVESYYMHWNGCMLTWAPLTRALFDANVTSLKDFNKIISALDFKLEPIETNNKTLGWVEENGHHFIDLGKQTLFTTNGKTLNQVVDYKAAFERRLTAYNPEARDHKRETNWIGIQDQVKAMFV